MASALNRFNTVSKIYDRLAGFVFGKILHEAQCYFIEKIPNRSKILIIGGGSGKFLEELLNRKVNSEVIYIEASSAMLEQAKRRVRNDSRVTFVHGTQNAISPAVNAVDVVITPFFLDLFSDKSLNEVTDQLVKCARRDALWIATDFAITSNLSQRILLWLMYRFFRITTRIEAQRLPDWETLLSRKANPVEVKSYRDGFIKTVLYTING